MVAHIYKIWSEDPSTKKTLDAPKHQNFGAILDNCDLMANIAGTQRDIVKQKTTLQT